MIFDLRSALPSLIPKAISWAEKCEADIALTGQALNDRDIDIARAVGVARPELIRIKLVNSVPMPSDPHLIQAAMATGLIGPNTNGMTLGCVFHGNWTPKPPQTGHAVQRKLDTHSTPNWTLRA